MTLIIRDELRRKKIRQEIEAKEEARKAKKIEMAKKTIRITLAQYIGLLNKFDPDLLVVLALGPDPDTQNDDDVANLEMHISLDMVESRKIFLPTVHFGFYDGLIALAEGFIVEEEIEWYRALTGLTIDLFGVPKYYRGKIRLRGKDYDLIIYETYFVPHTNQSYLLKK